VIQELKKIKTKQKEEKLALGKLYNDYNLIFAHANGSPVHLENLRRRVFNPAIEKVGLPKIRIHDLRHSSGTLLYKIFKDMRLVQRYLRHTKLSTTADIYVHDDDDIEMLQKAANEMAKALRPN
jgi:integrase